MAFNSPSGFTNNRGRKGFLLLAEDHGHVRLRQAGSQSHTMDPDDSSTSRGVWNGPFAFPVSRDPSSTWTVISHQKRKGERVGDGHDSEGGNEETTASPKPKLTHKLKVCKIVVSKLRCDGDKTVKQGNYCRSVGERKTAT